MKLCLLDLNHDVLLHIFQYLDVASVLRSVRVSSACNSLAHSKHVWLALVCDLGSRHLLDLPPRDTLLRFSTTQLIEEVKRAVFGPRTWAVNSPSAPSVRRRIHVPVTGSSPLSQPTLLSGDRHLLVQCGTGCEIWGIAEGRRIWARDGIRRSQKLLRGHLLALTRAGATSDVILYPLASLNPHWQALDSIAFPREASHSPIGPIEPIILQQVEYPVRPAFHALQMIVHESPLHRWSYIVSTHTGAGICSLDADSRLPALHRYRLTISSTSTPPTWERISCAGTINRVLIESLTYAGYGLSFPSRPRRSRLVCRPATGEGNVDGMWIVPLPEQHHDCVCLSTDTGALTICSVGGVDIFYYD
ncbi:hypothetical protein B0H11DRAFT_1955089 [Mycena galericulata]|nr:hypothetical protein B0H11DRAFT_1955089 [Mycena galericulata]